MIQRMPQPARRFFLTDKGPHFVDFCRLHPCQQGSAIQVMPARKSETITSWIIRFSATRVTQSITRIALPIDARGRAVLGGLPPVHALTGKSPTAGRRDYGAHAGCPP